MALTSTSDWSRDVRSPLVVIAQASEHLFPAERQVADFISANPEVIVKSTVADVARGAGTSDATVIRFCRSVGFQGFPELKLALARDITRGGTDEKENPIVKLSDPVDRLAYVTFSTQKESIVKTMEIQQGKVLETAVSFLAGSGFIVIVGDHTRASVVAEAERRFSTIGMNVQGVIEGGNIASAFNRLKMNDVVLSFPGSKISQRHSKLLKLANERGATAIVVSPTIARVNDDLAVISVNISLGSIDIVGAVLESIVAEIAIMEALFVAVAIRRHTETISALSEYEETVRDT